jgi:hypothetical protein
MRRRWIKGIGGGVCDLPEGTTRRPSHAAYLLEAIDPAMRAPAKMAGPTVTTRGPAAGRWRKSARRIPDPALAIPVRPLSSA